MGNRTEVPVSPVIASGEKAKARDILAAIGTVKTIEREQWPATAEERVVSRRKTNRWPQGAQPGGQR
jgi:hypothetical protein